MYFSLSLSLSLSLTPSLPLSLSLFNIDSSFPVPQVILPKELLTTIVNTFLSLPPLSFTTSTQSLSPLASSCLSQGKEFLNWILSASSSINAEEKRLALEIFLLITIQEGTLSSISSWALSVLGVMAEYEETAAGNDDSSLPSLSLDVCQFVLKEIHHKTVRIHIIMHIATIHIYMYMLLLLLLLLSTNKVKK